MAIRTQEAKHKVQDGGQRVEPAKQQLVAGLNDDLAAELQAILMYHNYAAKMSGPYRRELRDMFKDEIDDELGHAQILADKIAVLGGEPTAAPRAVPPKHDPREMVQQLFDAECETIDRYRRRIDEADAAGEIGLRVDLEDIVAEETRHRDDLQQILAGWHE